MNGEGHPDQVSREGVSKELVNGCCSKPVCKGAETEESNVNPGENPSQPQTHLTGTTAHWPVLLVSSNRSTPKPRHLSKVPPGSCPPPPSQACGVAPPHLSGAGGPLPWLPGLEQLLGIQALGFSCLSIIFFFVTSPGSTHGIAEPLTQSVLE